MLIKVIGSQQQKASFRCRMAGASQFACIQVDLTFWVLQTSYKQEINSKRDEKKPTQALFRLITFQGTEVLDPEWSRITLKGADL